MDKIIHKAIGGGYDFDSLVGMAKGQANIEITKHPTIQARVVLDPLFWQSLGKACGWKREIDEETGEEYMADPSEVYAQEVWLDNALHFHELNLIESWDSAVSYLLSLIEEK